MLDHLEFLLLQRHTFLQGFPEEHLPIFQELALKETFAPNQFLFQEGELADRFYLIHDGELSIECLSPGQGRPPIQTIGPQEAVGWSWLIPPHTWTFHARARKELQVFTLMGPPMRDYCQKNPAFGFELAKKLIQTLSGRLVNTRFQVLDIYGYGNGRGGR